MLDVGLAILMVLAASVMLIRGDPKWIYPVIAGALALFLIPIMTQLVIAAFTPKGAPVPTLFEWRQGPLPLPLPGRLPGGRAGEELRRHPQDLRGPSGGPAGLLDGPLRGCLHGDLHRGRLVVYPRGRGHTGVEVRRVPGPDRRSLVADRADHLQRRHGGRHDIPLPRPHGEARREDGRAPPGAGPPGHDLQAHEGAGRRPLLLRPGDDRVVVHRLLPIPHGRVVHGVGPSRRPSGSTPPPRTPPAPRRSRSCS